MPDIADRSKIIEAIKTPLGFFSLVVLVIEALLGGIAAASDGGERLLIVKFIVGSLALIVILVAVISLFRPEALWGRRYTPVDDIFAAGLGEEFYEIFDGYLSSLGSESREEAYRVFKESIESSPHIHGSAERKFSKRLVETIIRKAKIRGEYGKLPTSSTE